MYRNRSSQCTNCGDEGHHFRQCTAPITSYGILAIRQPEDGVWNPEGLEVLLIQRKDSIGFIELLRAKYKITDIPYIQEQIQGTVEHERKALISKPFHELWIDLWGTSPTQTRQYKQEYDQALQKFTALKEGFEVDGAHVSLKTLVDSAPLLWPTPEWGFPKGRRNPFESDRQCAMREFCEETGLTTEQFTIVENLEPIRETFLGNNAIHYCHVYFVAIVPRSIEVRMLDNELMKREIGDIRWFSFANAFEQIRTTNPEKRAVLTRVQGVLRKIFPVALGPGVKSALVDRNGRELCQFRRFTGGTREQQPSLWRTRKVWQRTSEPEPKNEFVQLNSCSATTSSGGSSSGPATNCPATSGEAGEEEKCPSESASKDTPSCAEPIASPGEQQREQERGDTCLNEEQQSTSSTSSKSSNPNPWVTATRRTQRRRACQFVEDDD